MDVEVEWKRRVPLFCLEEREKWICHQLRWVKLTWNMFEEKDQFSFGHTEFEDSLGNMNEEVA